jgi:uncharacterized protein (DUF1684 family)
LWRGRPGGHFVLLFIVLLSFWSNLSRKRAAFTADGTSFSAGTQVQDYVTTAAWLAYTMGMTGAPLSGRVQTYQPAVGLHTIVAGMYAALAIVFVILSAVTWLRPIVLALTPEGVVLRRFIGYRLTLWDALPPDRRAPGRREIRMITIDVDRRFAADAIEYYPTHPEYRAAIGSPTEHERLSQALREGQTADAAAPTPVEG